MGEPGCSQSRGDSGVAPQFLWGLYFLLCYHHLYFSANEQLLITVTCFKYRGLVIYWQGMGPLICLMNNVQQDQTIQWSMTKHGNVLERFLLVSIFKMRIKNSYSVFHKCISIWHVGEVYSWLTKWWGIIPGPDVVGKDCGFRICSQWLRW